MDKIPWLDRRVLRAAGTLIGVIGIAYVGFEIWRYAAQITLPPMGTYFWVMSVLLVITYALANVFLAYAWWRLLSAVGVNASWRWALRTYGASQLGKYVPGNIFHLAGRQMMAQAEGLSAVPVARSMFFELTMMTVIGTMLAISATPLILPAWGSFYGIWPGLVTAILMLLLLYLGFGRGIASAMCAQCLFLVVSGLVFLGALALLNGGVPAHLIAAVCGAYVLAWLAGFITPGAPAGIGVREVVLVLMLRSEVPAEVVLTTVMFSRIISMLGDLLFFAASGGVRQRDR